MDTQTTRAAAYIRVSTDDQTEFSPDAQLRAIHKYCEQRGFSLSDKHIYRESVSAKHAETRPKFMAMISEAKSKPKPFDVVLVHRFDRFARNREDSVVYKSLLRKQCGIKVISVTEQFEGDKFSIILESMLEAMAEYYSLNLADEVKKGMTEKALRGELQTPAPFGYVFKDGSLVPDKTEARTVKTIFELFVYENIAAGEIAKRLNDSNQRTKKGCLFQKRSIEYILKNPVYCGKIRWCPNRKSSVGENGIKDVIIAKGSHEALIDDATFELAANKASTRRVYARSNSDRHYLSGLLKCMSCGGNMYLCGKIFRCGNYLNNKCARSQGIAIQRIESLIAEQIPALENSSDIREIIRAAYFDKESGTIRIVYV